MLANSAMSKVMNDVVSNAVSEMRRYYSRKVIDVLVRITRQSVDDLRRRFSMDSGKLLCTYMFNMIRNVKLIFINCLV